MAPAGDHTVLKVGYSPTERDVAREATVLCHGDLHHGNVLRSASGPVVIDPRGVWGEPALDVGVALLNPFGSLPGDRVSLRALLERRLDLICPAMDVPVAAVLP